MAFMFFIAVLAFVTFIAVLAFVTFIAVLAFVAFMAVVAFMLASRNKRPGSAKSEDQREETEKPMQSET